MTQTFDTRSKTKFAPKILYNVFYDVIEISTPRIFLPEYFADPNKSSKRYVVYAREIAHPKSWGEEIKFEDKMVQELINRQEDTHAIAERSERMARSALAILNRIPFDRGKENGA